MAVPRICQISGCGKIAASRCLCARHYRTWRNHNDATKRLPSLKKCSMPNCGKPVHSRGFCPGHYQRWACSGDPENYQPKKPLADICAFPGCGRIGKITRGWCYKHYQRWQNNGDPGISRLDREQTGRPCKIEGCGKPSGFKGFCLSHGDRLRRTGDPLVASLNPRHRINQIWIEAHRDFRGEECLIWPFHRGDNGRGVFKIEGRGTSVSYVMCSMAHGEPPTPDHEASHSCGKGHEGCVNPRHLRWATRKENENDKRNHGTLRRGVNINTAKLSEDDVREIRRLGDSVQLGPTAKRFGITKTAVWTIKVRKTWAWLDDTSAPNESVSQVSEKPLAWSQWKKLILERDDFACRRCGDDLRKNLNAHHIEARRNNERERHRIDNGITLCKACHRGFHGLYGKTDFGREQLNEYLAGSVDFLSK